MKVINKIIYLIESPFNQRDYIRFGFDIFIKDGFEVYVWDLTPFVSPQAHKLVSPPDPTKYENLVQFKSKRDVISALNKQGNSSFIISFVTFNFTTYSIFKAISKKNIPYALPESHARPTAISNTNVKELSKKMTKITPRKLINYINYNFMKIPFNLLNINPATFVFAGGAKSLRKWPLVNSKTEVVWIHALDYDRFLEKTRNKYSECETIIFLDSYLPFHPEYTRLGIPPLTSPEEYYPALCSFFDYLENRLGLEIVIAAHPRSHYEKHSDLFRGRRVERGKTAELVRDSKLVVLHGSLSVNFAVLYEKPMIFITTDILQKTTYGRRCKSIAFCLGKTEINISQKINIDIGKELLVNKEIYAKYKNDYIKVKGSEELPFWQVVSSKIKSLNS